MGEGVMGGLLSKMSPKRSVPLSANAPSDGKIHGLRPVVRSWRIPSSAASSHLRVGHTAYLSDRALPVRPGEVVLIFVLVLAGRRRPVRRSVRRQLVCSVQEADRVLVARDFQQARRLGAGTHRAVFWWNAIEEYRGRVNANFCV